MITNIQSLKDKARNCAKRNNLTLQQVLQNYMFERFLDRLSKSMYKDRLIIKGGLLLSSIMGIDVRTTMDIDADITGMNFEKNQIEKMITEIIEINIEDNVKIVLDKIEDIREENEYGGYKFKLIAKFENLKIPFHIDISTGDIITPRAIEYRYKTILEDEYIDIFTYNQETIIAEKLQTILSRKIENSRMKDFYDLYYFVNFKWNEIDKDILNRAIKTTFENRETLGDLDNISNIVTKLAEDKQMQKLWKDYQTKHKYAENVEYESTIKAIKIIENNVLFSNV